ncbi:DUF2478 domain-containing protein [Pseudorhodobacter sp.]|uniref:DUF2478 domain-containing protein n=1 Tax=Pseudorhodobacter sp. TaxID=1934400 RepID=UPI0026493A44|nr:DUF2478 domain-containing protein [Pseudorhodobacter sp.]MDN5785662.1 DUF2478 domain-containing protein [Pseudorhodobacter sp.]
MLGYVTGGMRGQADSVLAEVATTLRAEGVALAGVVQVNETFDPNRACHMDLHVLSGDRIIRISQNLGSLSKGCRLDPAGLEQAVGLVEQALEAGPDLLIINKFGKQEVDGRGFRPLIGRALAEGIPVLTAVPEGHLAEFEVFAEGMGLRLACDPTGILAFCREHRRANATVQAGKPA